MFLEADHVGDERAEQEARQEHGRLEEPVSWNIERYNVNDNGRKIKKFKKSEITMEVGGWVQVSLGKNNNWKIDTK